MLSLGPAAPVPIYQHEGEFAALLELYRERKPLRVLEVGTYCGGTLYHWLQNARPGAVVVSVDNYAWGVDNRPLYRTWAPEGVIVEAVAGDSRDPKTIAQAGALSPYDWIFIDAGHYYEEVKADWESYRPLATPSAVVCFHDILEHPHNPEVEVRRLWLEIQREYETKEIVADPKPEWGGIGVVFLP